MASKFTIHEKSILSQFTIGPAHVWRSYKTYEVQADKTEASKWCMEAIHAENADFEAIESLEAKKMVYWHGGDDLIPRYRLTPKGFKAMVKEGMLKIAG